MDTVPNLENGIEIDRETDHLVDVPYPEPDSTVTLLLLGDEGCGKSLFLSRLKCGKKPPAPPGTTPESAPETLRDSDQPYTYDIRFSKKSFTLEIYDTSCPNQHWSTLSPDVIVIAFDISNRETLTSLQGWRNEVSRHFQHGRGERIPVMIIGLKRDLRKEGEGIIYPQEAYRIAQELRCDRYAECSAMTGELLAETFEDLSRLAGMSTTSKGGQADGGCNIL